MRKRPVVIIALSLLLIAGGTGFQLRGQVLHQLDVVGVIPGSAPFAIGSLWSCPSGSLKAYQPSMFYYPSYHPAPPPLATKPARCYRTDGEARSAGYRLAPPPAGGDVLDGVYLLPSSDRDRTNCEAVAAQLRIAIPCPTMLPPAPQVAGSFCFSHCTDGGIFNAWIAVTTPPDYPGAQAGPPGRQQIVLVLWGAALTSEFGQQLNQCSRGNLGPTVMKRLTLWVTCDIPSIEFPDATMAPDVQAGVSSGLTWEVDNWIYELGAAAPQTSASRRLVEFFASKLVAVSATGG
jgi:hypothetical protein